MSSTCEQGTLVIGVVGSSLSRAQTMEDLGKGGGLLT